MHIPTIYKKNIDPTNNSLNIDDDKLHHLNNVLRVKNNSPIKVSNGEGSMYFGKFKDNKVELTSKKVYERGKTINLFIPPIQDKTRFRFMIEKLGELNVNSITVGPTDYSQKININNEKIFNWLVSSIEQSGSPFIPDFETCDEIDFNKFNHALDITGQNLKNNLRYTNIAIGPEGGWSEDELDKFSYTSTINEFTFRTETAAIVAVSLMI
jgi:RsmE family RNA methyltransferase